jgi:para-nitrobenzyl esterase
MTHVRLGIPGLVAGMSLSLSLVGCSSDASKGNASTGMTPAASTSAPTAGAASASPASSDPTKVTLASGMLEGDTMGSSVGFLNIPYAKPPLGALRWQAPQKPDAWTGVRHETAFASPCPQPPSQQSPASTNEDCLYLNVWRPQDTTPGAPVMVWIHGGGFTTGSAADLVPTSMDSLWYDGQAFAERGVVLVSINYRLGVFGFFAHPELSGENSPVGNQGLLDQQHALRWVQDNITAFGGDPKNVTIFGQSAGSGSVCMHMVSPGSRGLFQRAIGESGGCTAPMTSDPDALNAQIKQFANDHDCPGDTTLECLRNKPASELVSSMAVDRTMGMDALRLAFNFGAVVDGPGGFLPEPAQALFDRGEVAQVPYILGSTTDEARLYFLSAAVPTSDDEYKAMIDMTYGTFADRVLAMYPIAKFNGDYRLATARISTDSGIVCGTHDTARRAAKAGLSVYMYNFNIPWSIAPDALGACHTSEISSVFGSPYNENAENTSVATAMNTYWATFAKTGDPNFQGAPATWPAFKPDDDDDDERLQFDPQYLQLHSFRKEECELWREYAGQ